MRILVEAGKALVVIVTCMSLIGCRATTTRTPETFPKELQITGTYVHGPSGRRFPELVGGFRRDRVFQYDAEGRTVSVGYNLEEPGRLITATVYLRSLPGPTFEDELSSVQHAHSNFTPAFDQATTLEREGHQLPCRLAGFTYDETFAHRYGPVSSYLMMCDTLPWSVKWRFTHLPTDDPGIGGVMKSLASALTVAE